MGVLEEHSGRYLRPDEPIRFCDACGAPCGREFEGAPMCMVHGPRWQLARHGCGSDVLLERDGRVLLTRRAHEPDRGCWEMPGGFARFGEHPADAARREAREELGIEIRLVEVLGVYVAGYGDDEMVQVTVFVAEPLGEPRPDPSEASELRWFEPHELGEAECFAEGHRQRLDDWARVRSGEPVPGRFEIV
jgi:8-oxo-dGTP diphosphatase